MLLLPYGLVNLLEAISWKYLLLSRDQIPSLHRLFWLRLGGEAVYIRWSGYTYEFFGEELPRDLTDTLGLRTGIELAVRAGPTDCRLQLGYRRDPQPVKVPATTLEAVTGGGGVTLWKLGLDVGYARYRGVAGGVRQSHTVVALTARFAAKEAN